MSKIRIGLIGAGGRGFGSFISLIQQNHQDVFQVKAVADPNAVRVQKGLDYFQLKADIHNEVEDLTARSDIDAVIITSPDYLHEAHALSALSNGKHVLVDKPLATTAAGCLRVIAEADKANRLLYMGFNLRHHAVIRRMKDLATAGAFGEIYSVQAIEHYDGGRTYHSRWNRMKEFSGGLWIHKGSHDFDVINYMMGDVKPARVSAFSSVFSLTPEKLPFAVQPGKEVGPTCDACPYRRECPDAFPIYEDKNSLIAALFDEEAVAVDGYQRNICMYLSEKDTHDQGIALVEYENGATASHSEYFATPISNRHYLIEGTAAHAEADLETFSVKLQTRWSKDIISHELQQPTGGHGGADPVMIAHFIDCLQNDKRPLANASDGAWSVAVGEAAEISRAQKRVVEISELMDTSSKFLR